MGAETFSCVQVSRAPPGREVSLYDTSEPEYTPDNVWSSQVRFQRRAAFLPYLRVNINGSAGTVIVNVSSVPFSNLSAIASDKSSIW